MVGAQTLIGREATVIAPCFPEGQVLLDGENRVARRAEGADRGDNVRVTARDGLLLVVDRV